MIYHMIFQEIEPAATEAELSAMAERTAGYTQIDGIEQAISGRNLGIAPFHDGLTHATLIVARDEAALRAFLAHPLHQASVQANGPLIKRRLIMDIEHA
jgi:Stress responsive A/B Barrel Domain